MDWKKFGKKLLFPPVWLMLILTVISTAALIFVFVKGMEESIPAYMVFALSFYTLCVASVYCVLVLPRQYRTIKQKIYDNPLGNRFLTDRVFRTNLSLSVSFVINMLYVGINLWSWHTLKS